MEALLKTRAAHWRNCESDPPDFEGRYQVAMYNAEVREAVYIDGKWLLPNGIETPIACAWKPFDEAPDDVYE